MKQFTTIVKRFALSLFTFHLSLLTATAQEVHAEIGATHQRSGNIKAMGFNMGITVLSNRSIGVASKFYVPFSNQEALPYVSTHQLCYQLGDVKTLTIYAGVATHKFGKNAAGDKIEKGLPLTDFTSAVGVEAGWQAHMGRLYVAAHYADRWYIGTGMKILFR